MMVCTVVAAGGLAGCGGSGGGNAEGKPSPARSVSDAQRMTEALTLFKGYRSFGLEGEVRDEVNTLVDLHVDRQGNCVGSYRNLGATTEFVVIGDRAWSAFDEKGLSSSIETARYMGPDAVDAAKDAAATARGKYVESSAAELTEANIALSLCRMDRAYADVPASVTSAEHSRPRTEKGERRVSLTHTHEDGEVVVEVPKAGTPKPRRIEFEVRDVPVLVDIDDYDVPVKVQRPDTSDVVQAEDVRGLNPFAD
ncbi:hypothetical protein SAMN02745898_101677 [Streptomyces sp. 136MFCol5.1]|nr:hypothetical protein SAMN02745898_101677 [Streptomyces sp. 136MFCol5.1]SFS35923.1 hypothetical protein SAMN04487982_101188 [Streptomyces sp. ok210]